MCTAFHGARLSNHRVEMLNVGNEFSKVMSLCYARNEDLRIEHTQQFPQQIFWQ